MHQTLLTRPGAVSIRPLRESELDDADSIFRLAFGTFIGLPDPMTFMSGAQLLRARWRTDPGAFLAADLDGALAGSSYATNWGSVGFVGPLATRPELWDRGIGQRLLEPTMELFRGWGTRHIGLFTFPHSPKHIALYQKFGFWPRSLTAIMQKPVGRFAHDVPAVLHSKLREEMQREFVDACFELSSSVYAGLDVRREVAAVVAQGTGDTVLLWGGSRLDAFAVCHCGPGSEAESGTCYVKFGVCRPGKQAQSTFERLLDACQDYAARSCAEYLVAGVNTARHGAYRTMLAGGFKPHILGVTMHRPNEPAYDREDVFLIDDWR